MAKHNIEKNAIGYKILYTITKFLHDTIYTEVVTINNPDNKQNQANIYAPNHQNALMDALAVLYAKQKPLVFLARSDIFQNKTVASILYFLKILPIYRIRDGYNSLKNNQEVFENTVRVLKSGRGLCILPEGSHLGHKQLRQLKKGFARIAFSSEIAGNEQVNVSIVPVAIDYTNYTSFNSRLTVVFGKPLPIKPFIKDYKEKQEIAINKLKSKLTTELKNLILNCESENNYDEIISASEIYAEYKYQNNPEKRFETQRKTIQLLDKHEKQNSEVFNNIIEHTKKIKKLAKTVPTQIIGLPKSNYLLVQLLLSILLIPIALPGILIFGLFWYWPIPFVNNKIADPQFKTSVRFGIYVIELLIILIASLIILPIVFSLKSTIILFITVILSSMISIKTWQFLSFVYNRVKWNIINITNNNLGNKHKINLINLIDKLISTGND